MLISIQCASEVGFGVTDTVKPGILMLQWHLPGGGPGWGTFEQTGHMSVHEACWDAPTCAVGGC